MKRLIVTTAVLAISTALHAQNPMNCWQSDHPVNGVLDEPTPVKIVPKIETAKWLGLPFFVHHAYQGRGTCKSADWLPCHVNANDIILISAKQEELFFSRKRGVGPFLEYDLPLTVDKSGRFAHASVPAAGAYPARTIFLLPLGRRACPYSWYDYGSNPRDECEHYLVEVFNDSTLAADVVLEKYLPSTAYAWDACPKDYDEDTYLDFGSAHEPPTPPP